MPDRVCKLTLGSGEPKRHNRPRFKVCAIYSTPLCCYGKLIISDQFNIYLVCRNEKAKQQLNQNKLYGPQREKTCLRRFTNNKGADQPVHTRVLQ